MFFCFWKVEKQLKWWFTATRRITIQTVTNFTLIFMSLIKSKIAIRASSYCTMTRHFPLWKCLFTSQNKLWKCTCSKTVYFAQPEWRYGILWQDVLYSSSKTQIKLERLPPTESAAEHHSLPVHCQILR